jgi:two-component system, LuxR family, sensor kinase FixL
MTMRLERSVSLGGALGGDVAIGLSRYSTASASVRHPRLSVRWPAVRTRTLLAAGLLIIVIAFVDSRVNLSFGLLYLFPIILVGTVLPRWQVVLTAFVCTWLTDLFNPFPFIVAASLPQDMLVFTSLAGTGLVAYEVTRSRLRQTEHLETVQREVTARREAEEQLAFLINTSPVAIVTMDGEGDVLLANGAAHRLFGMSDGQLPGRRINRYIPALGHVPSSQGRSGTFQTEMQCRGEREDGAVFLANVFFSTYNTASGPRLAALVVDDSAALQEREESKLEELLAGSRIVVAAVSHEVRNLCGAMSVIHENLVRSGRLAGHKDFDALGSLVSTLTNIVSVDLKQKARPSRVTGVELAEVLGDLRIVLDRQCEDAGISLQWPEWSVTAPRRLPPVSADRHHLLQVLLNLTKNSQRALQQSEVKRIAISMSVQPEVVSIRVTDTGPGLVAVENLFQPFQTGADATGLGLYLSRALLRSARGDLRYDPSMPGCSFVIDLAVAGARARTTGRTGRTDRYDTHSLVAC